MIPRLDLDPTPLHTSAAAADDLELVDTKEAATRVGVRRQTIGMWVNRGYLSVAVRHGQRDYFLWKDVRIAELATRRRGGRRGVA